MSESSIAVAVVGGGPVGLASAAVLSDVGYPVTLIAPRLPLADERTSALLAGSVSLLERLGVWTALASAAAPLRTMRIVDGTRRLIRAPEVAFEASEIGLPAFGYNVANTALIAELEKAVASRNVTRVDGLAETTSFDSDTITVAASDGAAVTARLAVAADGRRSIIRNAAGIATDAWSYPQAALVCNIRHTQPHNDTSTEFHTEHGPFTLVPLAGNRSSLVWVDAPEESRRRLGLSDEHLAAEIEARSASILGAVMIEGRRQVFPLSGMRVPRFADKRVMLVGEAAHLFPPIGAQGLNLGYRDVAALGDTLAGPVSDPGDAAHLEAYDRARRVDVMTRTAAVDGLNRTLLSDFLPVEALHGLGLFLIDRIPALRRFAMRQGVAAT